MFKVEIGHTLRRIIKLFYQFGIWRNEEETTTDLRKSGMRLLYSLKQISFIIFLLTCAFLSDDNSELIYLVELAITVTVLMIKLAYLLWRKEEILNFLHDPIVTHDCITDYDESVLVKSKITKIKKFIQVYAMALIGIVFLMILVPLPIFGSERKLPMFIRFDLKCDYDMILYWVTYIYAATCMFYCVIYNFTIVIVWYIMYNYSIEYKLLGNQFRRLGYAPKEEQCRIKKTRNSFPKNSIEYKLQQRQFRRLGCVTNEERGRKTATRNSLFQQELINLFRSHQKLHDTIEEFRSCFSTLFLVEITTGALSICASTYNLAYNTSENVFQMVFFMIILLFAFFDIFLVMYFGNEITFESDRLSYCLFESNWIEQSENTKRCVIIFCEMIKQPQQLTVFIYPMNLKKFTSIVNGAYSMFNILKSFT